MVYVLLILFELIYEVRYGDKHDFLSAVMLSFLMLLAGLFGFAEGHYLGLFYYLGIRFAIFDFSFAEWSGIAVSIAALLGESFVSYLLTNSNNIFRTFVNSVFKIDVENKDDDDYKAE